MDQIKLVKLAKKGDKNALLQLIFNKKSDYYFLALSYLKNEEDSMDVLEEMIIKVYDSIDQLKKEEAFYSWSKTILVNLCKKRLKDQAKWIPLDCDNRMEESHENHQIVSIYVQELLNHLNEKQKEAIYLKYFFDLDLKTISKITNTSLGTVKSRIHTGLKILNNIVRSEKE